MTSIKRITGIKTQAVAAGLLLALSATSNFAGTGGAAPSGIADREISRRLQRVQEAQAAVERGDKKYAEGDYEGALNEYKTALDLLPEAPVTQQLRDAVIERYCAAATELARERAKNGRYADAKQLLNDALARNPNCAKAKVLLKQLDDPDRYEPALTPEHAKNVEDVKRHLQMANSFENLGDHDNAIKEFQDVLRIDKYNIAARKGMERVEQQRDLYFQSARDHMSSKMLNDVNKGWEDQVPVKLESTELQSISNTMNASRYYTEKMNRIVFPNVQFSGASIDEAIEFLRIKSKDLDTQEKDPSKKGVNIILRSGPTPSTAQISLDLHDVPMVEALRYITELASMKFKVEPFAVVVVPVTDIGNEQYTRTYKVPPDFLSQGGGGEGGGAAAPAAPPDPFAANKPAAGGGAGPSVKGTAIDILKGAGISFPEGSSAFFNAATSQLIVKNTQPNLDAVEAFVDSLLKKVPQQIFITAKFVEVSQKNTDELGFDWLMGAFNLPGSNGLFGAGGVVGNSAAGPIKATDFPIRNPGGTAVGTNPISRGLRSGTTAIRPDSIDGLIQAQNLDSTVAPGIFTLSGVFTDPQFQVVIHALSQKKGVDLMSAPSVTTRSGQRASVEVVREFIYPTEFNPPQIPTNFGATQTAGNVFGGNSAAFPVTPTTPTAFTMRPVGVKMEVEPTVGPDGFTIDINLAPEVVEFDGFINYGSPIQTAATDALGNPTTVVLTENKINQPIFSTRKVQTAVTVWDGQTVAMGGLIREDVQDVSDKIPILGDIPLIGRLFQSKAEDHFKRNLMVFVTARLIDPSGQPVRQQKDASSSAGATDTVSVTGEPGVLPPIGK